MPDFDVFLKETICAGEYIAFVYQESNEDEERDYNAPFKTCLFVRICPQNFLMEGA